MNTTQAETGTIHPFERRGLGKAPFRFVGLGQQDLLYGELCLNRAEYEQTGISVTTKRGGTCAYCGESIFNVYDIVSADGRRFHVGSECVKKTGDEKLAKAVHAAELKAARAKRAVKARAVRDQLSALLLDAVVCDKIRGVPRGNQSLLDWARFMLVRAGDTGKARALKAVRAALT